MGAAKGQTQKRVSPETRRRAASRRYLKQVGKLRGTNYDEVEELAWQSLQESLDRIAEDERVSG